jgi:hypothetical protein
MRKAKKEIPLQYEYANGIRTSLNIYLRTEVKAAFVALAREGGCYQQHLMDALILHAVAATSEEKGELFRAAHEAAKASAVARIERKFAVA